MPERVTREEKTVELAILKAKEILQEAEHLGILELDEPSLGEEFKVKRPKKNPKEEKLDNLQIEGYGHVGSKEYFGKLDKALKNILTVMKEGYGGKYEPHDDEDEEPFGGEERRTREWAEGEDIHQSMQNINDAMREYRDVMPPTLLNTLQRELQDLAQQLKELDMGTAASPPQQPR